ncbi:PHP domain-containing protein [Desertibacillus haloalkaliphilus]|nr:PHP domain-containing protein [Desertibacillus haloalkaliphilus]
MHSTASDGGYSPSELMKKCAGVGLSVVSLTDHDTMDGVEEAITAAADEGIQVIPGIEFSTKYKGISVHVLGYGLDYRDRELKRMLAEQREMRRKRLDVILEKLAAQQISLQAEDVLEFVDGGSIGRPHIAKALVKHGYVKDVAEAFQLYLAEDKPCYVAKEREMTPTEAIEWIHKTKGVAILAHPVYYGLDEYIEGWVVNDRLDGVEVYHRDHSPEDARHYEQLVEGIEQKHHVRLLRTGGSDFHHEDYGRVREPLGVTRIHNQLADLLIKEMNERK